MTEPVVGRGKGDTSVSKPQVIPTTVLSTGVIADITAKLEAKGYKITPSTINQVGLVDSFTPEQLSVIYKLIKPRGYNPKKSIEDVRSLLNTDPIMLSLASRSTDYSTFVKNLERDLLPGVGDDTAANIPTRSIAEQRPEVLENLVDTWYKKVLSRPASKEEKAARLAEMQAEIAQGTVTTSKKVKNPKTGQMETVVQSTPGFSQASSEARITEQLKTLNPDDFDRAKRVEFSSWISQNVAGA
jgi:uncharacterized protein (UPF0297 family)